MLITAFISPLFIVFSDTLRQFQFRVVCQTVIPLFLELECDRHRSSLQIVLGIRLPRAFKFRRQANRRISRKLAFPREGRADGVAVMEARADASNCVSDALGK